MAESKSMFGCVQRLFSMFPTGLPGIALLLLRMALGVNLLHGFLDVQVNLNTSWMLALLSTVAIGSCIGLLTPVTAALSALIELVIWHFSGGAVAALHFCAILVAVALAMLGPGAYSLDAKLFGRRQVVFPPNDGTDDK
jgi:uncharacterized membrane protein YphA (DoxX/SURF4 family)